MNMVGVPCKKEHLQEGGRKGKAAELEPSAVTPQYPTPLTLTSRVPHQRTYTHVHINYTYVCVYIYIYIYIYIHIHNCNSFVFNKLHTKHSLETLPGIDAEAVDGGLGVKHTGSNKPGRTNL